MSYFKRLMNDVDGDPSAKRYALLVLLVIVVGCYISVPFGGSLATLHIDGLFGLLQVLLAAIVAERVPGIFNKDKPHELPDVPGHG
jgi:hypothetical protein